MTQSLARAGLAADYLTVLGTLVSLGAAGAVATGHLFAGGWVLLVGGCFDLLDGAVARAQGRATARGALLDATLDRVGEAGVLVALAYWFARQADPAGAVVAAAALALSLLVSYIKARAEGLALPAPEGLFSRPERLVALALGLVLSPLWEDMVLVSLALVVVLSAVTALQRFWAAWRPSRG